MKTKYAVITSAYQGRVMYVITASDHDPDEALRMAGEVEGNYQKEVAT